jgi:hypothetical protein
MYDDLNTQLAAEREKKEEYRREWESACERSTSAHALYDAEREKSAGLERERDAYKRAKAENDERFMLDLGTALAAQKAAEEARDTARALLKEAVDGQKVAVTARMAAEERAERAETAIRRTASMHRKCWCEACKYAADNRLAPQAPAAPSKEKP